MIVDLNQVTYINSIGVKNWVLWILRMPLNFTLRLQNCTPLLINQINTVKGFLPTKFAIESLYVPYRCDRCSQEQMILLKEGKDFQFASAGKPSKYTLPETVPCSCQPKQIAGLDVLESKYFHFLNSRKSV